MLSLAHTTDQWRICRLCFVYEPQLRRNFNSAADCLRGDKQRVCVLVRFVASNVLSGVV